MDDEKRRLINVCGAMGTLEQTTDSNLGITQEYNKTNRDKLWDSAKGKAEYKEKVFGEKETYLDGVSGQTLHKSQKAAQKKYHMKNEEGENVSSKWANHSAETDHVNAIKDVHDVAKHNPFLSDADFKEIVNSEENYRILSKSVNTSKGDKNDWQIICDKSNGISLEGRTQLAKEKVRADLALHGKFAAATVENVGKEFVNGAKDALVGSTILLATEGIREMMQVAQGEQSLDEAAKNMGRTVVDVAVVGGSNRILTDIVKHKMQNNEYFKKLEESGEIGKIIAVATIVSDSAVRYINGEIDGKEFIEEIGEKGTIMVAGMIGKELGRDIGGVVGAVLGVAGGPVGIVAGHVAGEVIGEILGTIITTVSCSAIVSVYTTIKHLDDYKLNESQLKRLEADAIREMKHQREKFQEIVRRENGKIDKEIQDGFDLLLASACEQTYSLQGVTEGLDKILAVFGKKVAFNSLEEYEAQLKAPLKLSF